MENTSTSDNNIGSSSAFVNDAMNQVLEQQAQTEIETETEDDLIQYTKNKMIGDLITQIVENLLLEKPNNPHAYIILYLLSNYPNETAILNLIPGGEGGISCLEGEYGQILGIAKKNQDDAVLIGNKQEQKQTVAVVAAAGVNHDVDDQLKSLDQSNNTSDLNITVQSDAFNVKEEEEENNESYEQKPRLPLEKPKPNSISNIRRSIIHGSPMDERRIKAISGGTATLPKYPKSEEERKELKKWLGPESTSSKAWLTSKLPESELDSIVDAMRMVSYNYGDDIVKQGDTKADSFFMVAGSDSKVVIIQDGDIVRECIAGDGFGEVALMYNAPRSATVRAISNPCHVWKIDRDIFKRIVVGASIERQNRFVSVLSSIPFLEKMSRKDINTLADAMKEKKYQLGDVIILQGDTESKTFYILLSGSVQVFVDDQLVDELSTPGQYFGEIALLNGTPRAATIKVSSTQGCEVAVLEKDVFQRLISLDMIETLKMHIPHYNRKNRVL